MAKRARSTNSEILNQLLENQFNRNLGLVIFPKIEVSLRGKLG
jgi:hypothetical protein